MKCPSVRPRPRSDTKSIWLSRHYFVRSWQILEHKRGLSSKLSIFLAYLKCEIVTTRPIYRAFRMKPDPCCSWENHLMAIRMVDMCLRIFNHSLIQFHNVFVALHSKQRCLLDSSHVLQITHLCEILRDWRRSTIFKRPWRASQRHVENMVGINLFQIFIWHKWTSPLHLKYW